MITVFGAKTTLDDLRRIDIRRPARAGNRWQGIRHHDLITGITKALTDRDIQVTKEVYSVSGDGQSLVGGLNVRFPPILGIPVISGMEYSLGLRHSNNMKHALKIAVGTQVMVCENGVITGEFVLSRRHTTGIDLHQEIDKGVDRFIEEGRKVDETVNQLKYRRLPEWEADHILMQAGRRRLLPWSHIGMVEKEYQNPTHIEFTERTGWGLYNSFNHIAKKSNPERQLRALNIFREIILN